MLPCALERQSLTVGFKSASDFTLAAYERAQRRRNHYAEVIGSMAIQCELRRGGFHSGAPNNASQECDTSVAHWLRMPGPECTKPHKMGPRVE